MKVIGPVYPLTGVSVNPPLPFALNENDATLLAGVGWLTSSANNNVQRARGAVAVRVISDYDGHASRRHSECRSLPVVV